MPPLVPGKNSPEYNPNSNENYTQIGMLETILINIACFIVVMALFESNRYYKQIYLKRLQNRFQVGSKGAYVYFIITFYFIFAGRWKSSAVPL